MLIGVYVTGYFFDILVYTISIYDSVVEEKNFKLKLNVIWVIDVLSILKQPKTKIEYRFVQF